MSAAAWRTLTLEQRAGRVLPLVLAAVAEHGGGAVGPQLVMGVIRKESDFAPWATATHPGDLARGGSYGLMQMSLETARALGYRGEPGDREQLTGLYDPRTNLSLGVRYLADLLRSTNGNVAAAVSGYNAGLSTVRRGDGKRVTNDPGAPFINQDYVDRVLRFSQDYSGPVLGAIGVILVAALAIGALRRWT